MKTFLIALAVSTALLVGVGVAEAAPRDVQQYLERAGEAAAVKVQAAGVDVGPGLDVKGRVGSDGGLNGLHVVRSSGSAETDQKALKALKRLRVAGPPNALIGAEVTVNVAREPVLAAKTP